VLTCKKWYCNASAQLLLLLMITNIHKHMYALTYLYPIMFIHPPSLMYSPSATLTFALPDVDPVVRGSGGAGRGRDVG